jgi:hypothetical protein
MKARSTVHALLAVAEQLVAARKAARSKRAASPSATSGARVAQLVPETRPVLVRLTPRLAS